MNAYLLETEMREGDVDSDHWDDVRLVPMAFVFLLVSINLVAVIQGLSDSLDKRYEGTEMLTEGRAIGDLEEVEGLSLLRHTRPEGSCQWNSFAFSISHLQDISLDVPQVEAGLGG